MTTATVAYQIPALNGKPHDPIEDAEVMARWLRVFHGDSPAVELRALKCVEERYRAPHQRRGYFDPAHFGDMAKAALRLSLFSSPAVYMTLNPVHPDLLSRCFNREESATNAADDSNVTKRNWLLIDIDPKRIADVSATDEEKSRAFDLAIDVRRFLFAAGWPEPIFADSGNGYHLFYRIDLPTDDGGIVANCLKALAHKFSNDVAMVDTSVFNPSRIVKLPGTLARKGDNTPNRPWRRSKIVSIPQTIEIVPLDVLESLASCAPKPTTKSAPSVGAPSSTLGPADHKTLKRVQQYMAKVPPAVSGQKGHDATLKAANILIHRWALPEDQAFALLLDWNQTCEPPWDEDELRRKLGEAQKKPVGEYGELRREREKPARERKPKPVSKPPDNGASPTIASGTAEAPKSIDARVDIGGWCDQSDLGNARLFVKLHADRVRFCHPWNKWLVYDGKRWAVDETGAVDRLAKDVADQRWREALENVGDEDGMKFAVKSAQVERIAALLKLARSEPGIPIMPVDLDRDPWLLNCANGTVDLRSGELRAHSRDDRITKLCPTNFNPDAESYWWDRFLEAIFSGSQALIDFCRRYFGYSATGDVREQILLILWGNGSNGKSTLLNALMDALGGDYTLKAVADLLLIKKNESHPTERADLFGKRFVVCVETSDGRGLNEALVKELTGGDRIRARRLYEDFWEFLPTHKPALCTNHKPRVRGTDHAIWRRLALLPFSVQFWNPDKGETGPDELKQDKCLPEKLRAESEGILAWMVRGCLEWQQQGLQLPPEVRLATADYQQEQDSIGAFIAEKCILADTCKVRATALYEAYREWSEAIGEHPLGQRKFGESMTAKGFERLECAGIWYRRIGLVTKP